LETGKKHQIRVHLSHKTLPIMNDPVYHPKPGKGRLMLAAVELGFNHPRSKERLKFTIPAPAEFQLG
jgi:23S rRNA pseudouridine1911/1915/1917 synthase